MSGQACEGIRGCRFPTPAVARAVLLRQNLAPDVVLLHTSPSADDTVSLGVEVNVLPAAVESARRALGLALR